MASLTQQIEELQKIQSILAEKLDTEVKTKLKLAKLASIERLETLIEPITKLLDWVKESSRNGPSRPAGGFKVSLRDNYKTNFELQLQKYNQKTINYPTRDYGSLPRKALILETEEIYVTLIGILKKLDERIRVLENSNQKN